MRDIRARIALRQGMELSNQQIDELADRLVGLPFQAITEDASPSGEKLFALGRFDEALEQYEKAFEAKPLPGFLFNIAQCHRNLGNIDQAIFSYRKYLREAPDADNRIHDDEVAQQLGFAGALGWAGAYLSVSSHFHGTPRE